MKKIKQLLRIITIILISAVLLLMLLAVSVSKPPVKEFKEYHKMISDARKSMAHHYAAEIYANAKLFREEAYTQWQTENEKYLYQRDYSESKRMILIALSMAEEAKEKAEIVSLDLPYYKDIGILSEHEIKMIEEKIHAHYIKWSSWIDEAIFYSKEKKSITLIIDKYVRKCYVYRGGKLVRSFNIELGKNWLKDKQHKGDNTTPEGKYYITSKKVSQDALFYKILLLNFPNQDDKAKFESELKNKKIPDLSVLDEKILIHGEGGKGSNWTNGSIALKNGDMDIVFNIVKIGTPVVIVGTLNKELSKTLKSELTKNNL